MTSLIAILSSGKGSWNHIQQLMKNYSWENTYLITNDFGKENFKSEQKFTMITMDMRKPIPELRDIMKKELQGKLGMDAAVNLVSGTGEEHMALLSALLGIGVGIRLVIATANGMEEL